MKGIERVSISFQLPELCCKRCGNIWWPRKKGVITNCPSCRSIKWNDGVKFIIRKFQTVKCPKCAFRWTPRRMKLNECPKCKQQLFNRKCKNGN